MSVPAVSLGLDAVPLSGSTVVPPASAAVVPRSDGGSTYVPVQTRSERFASNRVSDFPPVTGLEVEWKFTPVRRLLDLTEGDLDGAPFDFELTIDGRAGAVEAGGDQAGAGSSPVVDGIEFDWVDRADDRIGSAGIPEERASANAWSSFDKALAITVTGDEALPVTITRSSLDDSPRAAHTVITAAPNSRGHIVLQNTGRALLSENVEIVLEQGSVLTVVSVQEWAPDAIHLASHFASIGKDARLVHIVISLDGSIVRVNSAAHLAGDGADVELDGAYFSGDGQHIEQQVFVDHVAPRTKSRVTYKGALQGRARSVWIGDVLIRNTAVATDSYEQNRNLLLTSGARADSIPNLEIETGDIAGAGHASASGRFDDEQLFYLQARGISEDEARRLVVRGFLAEIVQKIGSEQLETRLQDAIESALVSERVG